METTFEILKKEFNIFLKTNSLEDKHLVFREDSKYPSKPTYGIYFKFDCKFGSNTWIVSNLTYKKMIKYFNKFNETTNKEEKEKFLKEVNRYNHLEMMKGEHILFPKNVNT